VPRGRKADNRLGDLERRLDALEAREASLPERPEYTDGEIAEIGLILLAYVYEGDTDRFAEYLVEDHALPIRKAEEIASMLGSILEDRRATAENPAFPV
jgi:hypothetical protein